MKETSTSYVDYQSPEKQLLLVHAFNPFAEDTQPMMAKGEIGVDPEFNQRQAIDILENPTKINQRISLSTSLIEIDGKNKTWGHAGYIISVPGEDVISTSTSDAGSSNSNYNKLIQQQEENRRRGEILPPSELIRQSKEYKYNEVLVFAKNAKIVGCFVKIGPDGKPIDEELARKVRKVANMLSVECREIKISNKEADKIADTFRAHQVYSLKDSLFVGLVEGEGLDAIKYNIDISKTDNLVTKSTNIENWKMVSGKYIANDLRQTPIEKTIEILTRAREVASNTPEQTSAIEKAIINCLAKKEVPSTTATLREENAKVGCFSSIINSIRSCLR
jgi:hypothetical protein